jgi:hypothetical protein
MAADIAAKSNSGMPDEPAIKPTGPVVIDSRYGPVPNVAMSAPRLEEDQPMYRDIGEAQISSAFEDRPGPLRAAARREHPVQMSRTPQEVTRSPPTLRASASMAARRPVPPARLGDSLAPFPAPTHKPAKRRLFIWGAALSMFAGLCVFGGLAFYQMAPQSVSVTEQSTRGGMPVTGAPDSTIYGANSRRPAADALGIMPAAKDTQRSRADLIERVRTLTAAGNIDAVRAALSRLVEGGNASAAVDLGLTYDPNILDALGVRDLPKDGPVVYAGRNQMMDSSRITTSFPADVAKARVWYQRAQQMGAPEAVGLLENLERSERGSR